MTEAEVRSALPGWAVGVSPVRDLSKEGGPLLWSAVRNGARKQVYALSPEDLVRRCRAIEGVKRPIDKALE
jgi:hypothetical protein